MGQAQCGFEHADEGTAGAALFGVIAAQLSFMQLSFMQLDFRQFQVPIAILIPHKLVDG